MRCAGQLCSNVITIIHKKNCTGRHTLLWRLSRTRTMSYLSTHSFFCFHIHPLVARLVPWLVISKKTRGQKPRLFAIFDFGKSVFELRKFSLCAMRIAWWRRSIKHKREAVRRREGNDCKWYVIFMSYSCIYIGLIIIIHHFHLASHQIVFLLLLMPCID